MAYDFEREMGIEERLEATAEIDKARYCPNCGQIGGSYIAEGFCH
jgi:hypothetical protein